MILKRFFDLLDIRGNRSVADPWRSCPAPGRQTPPFFAEDGQLDDVQFLGFMKASTDLSDSDIYKARSANIGPHSTHGLQWCGELI